MSVRWVVKCDRIVWKRDYAEGSAPEFRGWQASVDGRHVGTVFLDGDVSYDGNCYSFRSHALAAEHLALHVERGGL